MPDLTDGYLRCSSCGKRVSSAPFTQSDYVVRAFVECPECIESHIADDDAQAAQVPGLRARVAELEGALSSLANETHVRSAASFYCGDDVLAVADAALSGSLPPPSASSTCLRCAELERALSLAEPYVESFAGAHAMVAVRAALKGSSVEAVAKCKAAMAEEGGSHAAQ